MESIPTPQAFTTTILSPVQEALDYVVKRMVVSNKVRIGDSYGWIFARIATDFKLSTAQKAEVNRQLISAGWRVEWNNPDSTQSTGWSSRGAWRKTTLFVIMPYQKQTAGTPIPPPTDLKF